ncbi:MAG: hypothetical protein JWM81_877 [Candidatus Saccharibacteria bacterium]|nr:hypothetical protein [Candidatus Saccharibacteria bacterium]
MKENQINCYVRPPYAERVRPHYRYEGILGTNAEVPSAEPTYNEVQQMIYEDALQRIDDDYPGNSDRAKDRRDEMRAEARADFMRAARPPLSPETVDLQLITV